MNTRVDPKSFSRARQAGGEFLDAPTERDLARAWREQGDEAAMHRLILAHRPLARGMVRRMRHSRVPQEDLLQQADLAMIRAAQTFDPERGFRFSTYAAWWIRSYIQEFSMQNASLVRLAAGKAQKAAFSNLNRMLTRMEQAAAAEGADHSRAALLARAAEALGVPRAEMEAIAGRIAAADSSLNAPASSDEGASEMIELLADADAPGAEQAAERLDRARLRGLLRRALAALPGRERRIVLETSLRERPMTLDQLSKIYGISRERVRQLRLQGLKRLRKAIESDPELARLSEAL
ncbi:MAG: sigma-70 family RNA polymerase sigma factor [Pseudomonadota bacterium]